MKREVGERVSEGATGDRFAALLRELKDRSGLSYGALAKRLHTSTSTLHRYVNGDAVPADYAPVERLARICRASPEELVELHRRWVLADALRGRRTDVRTPPVGKPADRGPVGKPADRGPVGEAADRGPVEEAADRGSVEEATDRRSVADAALRPPVTEAADRPPAPGPDDGPGSETSDDGPSAGTSDGRGSVASAVAGAAEPASAGLSPGPAPVPAPAPAPEAGAGAGRKGFAGAGGTGGRRRGRTVLVAGVAVAAVLGAVALAVGLPSGDPADGGGKPVGAAGADGVPDRSTGRQHASVPPKHTGSPSASPSASASASGPASASGAAKGEPEPEGGGGRGASPGNAPGPAPLSVSTDAYTWDSPCTARYLIDRSPARVAPPPNESDATAWAAAHGAVSSGSQYVTLTVQGTGDETVVVKRLRVVAATKRAPLAWNDYAMGYPGVGCGGGVPSRSFTVALDAARPAVVPEAGHRDFPFKVSESDPEEFRVEAAASAYDVSWYLELSWSSGSRQGVLRVDDHGRPFRTSGAAGRPAYEFPLGGSGWVKEGTTEP
ncbi:helix-turn-helix domain-containing protein [Streptomyces sp. NPDC048514]|uniref:helix-turn-helix domain-containing protein n=1 Tax=Streptomyces sp. NPDC048514 TaxID=3365564 RepID=UPI003715F33D